MRADLSIRYCPIRNAEYLIMVTLIQQPLTAIMLCAFMCASVGCQRSDAEMLPVTGTATFNSQPIAQGHIVLWSLDDKVAPDSGTIVEGKFEFRAHAGRKRIEIHAERAGQPDAELKMPTRIQFIPAKYNSQSKLTAEVSKTGENHFDFPLTD